MHQNLEHKPAVAVPVKLHSKQFWELTWGDTDEEIDTIHSSVVPTMPDTKEEPRSS